ncbi:ATP-binding cassette domain-containing protein [Brachybacterium saurashtrense]|uniref:ATP-binding cassette domain-containing protein n=1 Tax=Brachybacterium saurashtrense TaxID=556288 RepID=A0A345YT93_9MICO|nr:ATP-binding cassette domain-containing protein [Brachybacterium saurashtrense]AXK47145.1 ATP-binding cassette domain-containing protein [Brachybacterium saurashtrense]RRR23467.1 ATP-binding cassette domain-containing protein [Brachybacterium saurashtrense]
MHLDGLRWRPLTRREPTIAGLDLEIPAGQRVLLAGASGSGKSTVLRALAGLLDPEDGEGTALREPPERAGEAGLLLQNPAHAMVAATTHREACFGPENAALPRPEIHERAAAALAAAKVGVAPSRPPLDASGGQQQRIALAGTLALDPSLLLLDEPTSMLDEETAEQVREAILAAARDATLVLAEHRLGPWLEHMDRLVVLGPQARVLADGPPAAVLAAHPDLLREAGVLAADGHAADGHAPDEQATDGPVPDEQAADGKVPDAPDGEVIAALRQVTVPSRGLTTPLDLALHVGRLTALTGPSGAGKTTVLRTLLGAAEAASGTVDRPAPERIAAVPQNPEHSFVAATVRAEVTASPWAEDPDLAEELLHRAGLAHLADVHPHRLSGGEQRRLAIAAALAQAPDLLVLDEPTVGLDAHRRDEVGALLAEATSRGAAVLVATHDAELIARADHHCRLPAPPSTTPPPPPRRRVPADALNPLTLSLLGILAAIGSFAVQTWQGGLLALLPTVLLAPLAVRTPRGAALRLLPVLLSAAGLAWTTALLGEAPALSGEAWLLGLKEAARITAFVAPGVLALASVEATALGDALGQRLRLPARPVVASVVALVRVGHLGRQWDTIVETRSRRGLGGVRSPRLLAGATLALLVDTLRGAEQQALAMDARGFAAADRRTWAEPSPLGRADLLGAVLAVGFLVWPALAELLVG